MYEVTAMAFVPFSLQHVFLCCSEKLSRGSPECCAQWVPPPLFWSERCLLQRRAGQRAARQLTPGLVSWDRRKWGAWFQKFSLLRCNGKHIVAALGHFFKRDVILSQGSESVFLGVFATGACSIRQFGELRKTKASSSSVDLFEGGGGSQEWYRHKVTNY